MKISKINQQIQDFCTASGFKFGGKATTSTNLAQTEKLVWEEEKDIF